MVLRRAVVLCAATHRLAVGVHRRHILRPVGPVHSVLLLHPPHHRLPDEGRSTPGDGGRDDGDGKVVQMNNAPSKDKSKSAFQYMTRNCNIGRE